MGLLGDLFGIAQDALKYQCANCKMEVFQAYTTRCCSCTICQKCYHSNISKGWLGNSFECPICRSSTSA